MSRKHRHGNGSPLIQPSQIAAPQTQLQIQMHHGLAFPQNSQIPVGPSQIVQHASLGMTKLEYAACLVASGRIEAGIPNDAESAEVMARDVVGFATAVLKRVQEVHAEEAQATTEP